MNMRQQFWWIYLFLAQANSARNCNTQNEVCVQIQNCPSINQRLKIARSTIDVNQRRSVIDYVRRNICGASVDRTVCCSRDEATSIGRFSETRGSVRKSQTATKMHFLGSLVNIIHDIAGDVYSDGEHRLLIKNAHYDGLGIEAFFIGSTIDNRPSATNNIVLPYPSIKGRHFNYEDRDIPALPAFKGEDILLNLPSGVTVNQLKYISIWCRKFNVSFGHLILV